MEISSKLLCPNCPFVCVCVCVADPPADRVESLRRLFYSKKILGMHLCKVSLKNRGLTGIFNADTLLDLIQKSK
jgi:hypothetical protein